MRSGLGACQAQHATTIWQNKTRQQFHNPGCFNLTSEIWTAIIWFFTGLILWAHLLNKWSEAAIHICARKIIVLKSCKMVRLTTAQEKCL